MNKKQWFALMFFAGWVTSVILFETFVVPRVWPRPAERLYINQQCGKCEHVATHHRCPFHTWDRVAPATQTADEVP